MPHSYGYENVLSAAKLKSMPFRIVPPTDMENLIWAGDTQVRNRLHAAARSPRADGLQTSELVLIYGEFGSGKTHTMKYLAKELRQDRQLVAYLPRFAVVEKVRWNDLVRELFANQFSRADIVKRLSPLRHHILTTANERAVGELGSDYASNRDKVRILEESKRDQICGELLSDCAGFIKFILDLTDPSDTSKADRNWRFLSTRLTPREAAAIATEYGIPTSGMNSDHDAGLLLQYFCKAMTYQTSDGPGSEVIYIFFDETEDLIDIKAESRQSLMRGLRDIVNTVTEHMFIGLAATVSDAAELYGIFDESIMQRLSRRPVPIPQLSTDAARKFVLDELRFQRPQEFSGPPEWPFSPEGLDAFLHNMTPPITLRKINVSAQRLLFDHCQDRVLREETIGPIEVENFVDWGEDLNDGWIVKAKICLAQFFEGTGEGLTYVPPVSIFSFLLRVLQRIGGFDDLLIGWHVLASDEHYSTADVALPSQRPIIRRLSLQTALIYPDLTRKALNKCSTGVRFREHSCEGERRWDSGHLLTWTTRVRSARRGGRYSWSGWIG